jgi:hypothetical protein
MLRDGASLDDIVVCDGIRAALLLSEALNLRPDCIWIPVRDWMAQNGVGMESATV